MAGKSEVNMSLFKWLFGPRRLKEEEVVQVMMQLASEADRTYRGFISTYNMDVQDGLFAGSGRVTSECNGEGLFRARLIGVLFGVFLYANASADLSSSKSGVLGQRMFQIAGGIAYDGMANTGKEGIALEKAREIGTKTGLETLKKVMRASKAGPMIPGECKPEHEQLVEELLDAICISVCQRGVDLEVRERFRELVQGNLAVTINYMYRLIASR